MQGISFSKWDVKFKGSKIDRNLSYGRIKQQLESNRLEQAQKMVPSWQQKENIHQVEGHLAGKLASQLLRPEPEQPTPDSELTEQQKRKRKRKNRHL